MITLQIKELKNCMSKLLASDCFDSFLLEEASVTTAATYLIDGHVSRDFYTKEEWEDPEIRPYDFAAWSDVRPICYQMIKGRRTPARFKFVLHLKPDYMPGILKSCGPDFPADQVKALVLTCKYNGTALTFTTGTAFHTFLLDKSLDAAWDKTMRQFLLKKEISYTE